MHTADQNRSGGGDADLAALGVVLADRARVRILLALGDGRCLPASTLAAEAGVAAPGPPETGQVRSVRRDVPGSDA